MGSTSDGKVIEEVKVEGKAEQLWKKGKTGSDGYFTLENSKVTKIITAIIKGVEGEWKDKLVLRGNITFRRIPS